VHVDVSKPDEVEQLAARAVAKVPGGAPARQHAGVAGGGGYVWESSLKDWQWLLGVISWFVNGIRSFRPADAEAGLRGHSSHGLRSRPGLRTRCPSTTQQARGGDPERDAVPRPALAKAKMGVSVLCPPTSRPTSAARSATARRTGGRRAAHALAIAPRALEKAIASGRLSAARLRG